MKHLIIFAHPSNQSLNGQLKDSIVTSLLQAGQEVEVRDLYQIRFNPVLSLNDALGQRKGQVSADVQTEQDYIRWADSLIFIHPIWWTGLPAILKGYIDRVFSYGFAYRYDQGVQKGLLTGKQATIINTHGKSTGHYKQNGIGEALALTSDLGIYQYCGLQINRHLYFDEADRADAAKIDLWKKQVQQIGTTQIRDEEQAIVS